MATEQLNAGQVDDVNTEARMKAADVRADVRGLLGAVQAVRTLEPRRLPALVLEMLLQVVLPIEDAAALRAGEPGFVSSHVQLRGVLAQGDQAVEGKSLVCKQKRGVEGE